MSLLLETLKAAVRARLRSRKIGRRRSEATRRKISQAMQGKSNFQGKTHTAGTKKIMSDVRGHSDQGKVGGTRWFKTTAYAKKQPDRRANTKPSGFMHGR